MTTNLGVVCHDAGGAEIISSYVSTHCLSPNVCVQGPALGIFKRKLSNINVCSPIEVVEKSDWLLCGTSWQSDLEWRLFETAKKYNKKTIAFLDHWVNYRERFIRDGKEHLPSEIWVGDNCAKSIATVAFPGLPIELVANPTYAEIISEFRKLERKSVRVKGGRHLLFVSDNLGESLLKQFGNERHWGYTDEDTFNYLMQNIGVIDKRIDLITVRPHPSESINKFTSMQERYGDIINLVSSSNLLEDIANNDVIVGSESMAMVVALLVGKRVISCIPPGGKACALPHNKIEILQNIVACNKGFPK